MCGDCSPGWRQQRVNRAAKLAGHRSSAGGADCADSGRSRSAFRGESDHDSWLIPISIPARKRSPFLGQADQGSRLAGRVIGMVRNWLWKRVWRRWTPNYGYLASEEEVKGARKASVPCARPEKFCGCISISNWGSGRLPAAPTSARANEANTKTQRSSQVHISQRNE